MGRKHRLPNGDDMKQILHRKKSLKGFTLIEMMIALVLTGILLGLGVPTYSTFIKNSMVASNSNALVASILFSRSEAIKRNGQIVIQPISSDWANGWNVLSGATVLQTHQIDDALTVTGPGSISFSSDGRVSSAIALTFISTDPTDAVKRCLNIGLSGRAKVTLDRDLDGSCESTQ